MCEVRLKSTDNIDIAIKKFKRECEKAGVPSEIKKREYYEKPSERRKKKIMAARKKQALMRRNEED